MNPRWNAFFDNARQQHGLSAAQASHGLAQAVRHVVRQSNHRAITAAGISRTRYLEITVATDHFRALYLYSALTHAGRVSEAIQGWHEQLRKELITVAEALAAVPESAPMGNQALMYALTAPYGLSRERADRAVLRVAYMLGVGYPYRPDWQRDHTLTDVLTSATVDELRDMLRQAAHIDAHHPDELTGLLRGRRRAQN
ncbi:hypothetical protein [Streptomyces spiramyceticus]|uniref:hypothetical protein n=1 Tax=Streptomyces spiramyceticus TaxID=299717 RepID=UPI00237A657F|nr:hypothetical protein [Streptomyces spiramyceticus]